jgi:hypothetical protein
MRTRRRPTPRSCSTSSFRCWPTGGANPPVLSPRARLISADLPPISGASSCSASACSARNSARTWPAAVARSGTLSVRGGGAAACHPALAPSPAGPGFRLEPTGRQQSVSALAPSYSLGFSPACLPTGQREGLVPGRLGRAALRRGHGRHRGRRRGGHRLLGLRLRRAPPLAFVGVARALLPRLSPCPSVAPASTCTPKRPRSRREHAGRLHARLVLSELDQPTRTALSVAARLAARHARTVRAAAAALAAALAALAAALAAAAALATDPAQAARERGVRVRGRRRQRHGGHVRARMLGPRRRRADLLLRGRAGGPAGRMRPPAPLAPHAPACWLEWLGTLLAPRSAAPCSLEARGCRRPRPVVGELPRFDHQADCPISSASSAFPGASWRECRPADETSACSDCCRGASDGECDDGGPGSAYTWCSYGADCTDCGNRTTVLDVRPSAARTMDQQGAVVPPALLLTRSGRA